MLNKTVIGFKPRLNNTYTVLALMKNNIIYKYIMHINIVEKK